MDVGTIDFFHDMWKCVRNFRRLFSISCGCGFGVGFKMLFCVWIFVGFSMYFGIGFLLIFGCYFECGFVVGFWMLFWVWIFVSFWMFFWVWIRCWFLDVILGVDFLLDHLFLGLCTGKRRRVLYIEAVCRSSALCLLLFISLMTSVFVVLLLFLSVLFYIITI